MGSIEGDELFQGKGFREAKSLHKKWNFPSRISAVNVTKSAGNCDLVTFTEEILNGKLHNLCNG